MGFRTYIGKISKEEFNKIKDKSFEEMPIYNEDFDEDEMPGPYDLVEMVYELGKYVNIEKETYCLFSDDHLNDYYNQDYTFIGLTQEGFRLIINDYVENTHKYYQGLFDSIGIIGVDDQKIKQHFASMVMEWKNNPVNLNLDVDYITDSWKYEYAIFELVRLFKVFDWDNDIAVIYGY